MKLVVKNPDHSKYLILSDKQWIERWKKENNITEGKFWKLIRILIENEPRINKIIKHYMKDNK